MINFENIKPKILVIGDLIVDQYIWGSSSRISPEAPVQVIDVDKESTSLGGAGNVVQNLKVLGSEVDIISVIGKCETSRTLLKLFKEIKVATNYLALQKDRIPSKKTRVIAAHQQVMRYDSEGIEDINPESEKIVLKTFEKIVKNYDLVLLSDYGKGLLTAKLTKNLISIAKKNQKKVLIDPKGFDYSKYHGAYLLTPNKKEASQATNITIKDNDTLKEAITSLKHMCNLEISLITLSEQGVAIYDEYGNLRIYPTTAIEVFDVTGAGDTILASLGFAIACNNTIDNAVEFSNLASGVVVGKIGSSTASITEIFDYESRLNKTDTENSFEVKSWEQISVLANEIKDKGKKIVFTNGCFDILHLGHVKYLEKAKSFGDILIVGVNSDKSVSKLKGTNRPVNSQIDRSYLIASLKMVDYVVIFNEDTPTDLINLIKPEILVKGSDYEGKTVAGEELVKELKLVKLIEGKSTTKIINKINNE